MIKFSLVVFGVFVAVSHGMAGPQTVVEDFDEALPANWGVRFGEWKTEGGVLICREVAEDNHAAASRWKIPLQDGVIEARLRLNGASAFHIGFDPKPGTLKKKGHLYSLIISPSGAKIMKHVDKADPNSKNEVLAVAKTSLPEEGWLKVRLEAQGNQVSATVGEGIQLIASDPSFGVPKPGVVFRCAGESAELDQVAIVVKK
ncbi:MAG: hypothetical protein AAGH89_07375 [Verrucomicrobiota bacterium]